MADIGSMSSREAPSGSLEAPDDPAGKVERLLDILGRRIFGSAWPGAQFSPGRNSSAINQPWSNLHKNAPGLAGILLAGATPSPQATRTPQFILPTFPQYQPTPRPGPHLELPPFPTPPVLEPNPFYPDNMPTIQYTPVPWWLYRAVR
jgi:hypothetical protein